MKPELKLRFLIPVLLVLCTFICQTTMAQSILGKWQMVKKSDCMEENMSSVNADTQQMLDDMKGMKATTPQVVTFKEKMNGEESTRILNKRKSSNSKSFLYKFNGESLMILDKKSQTLIDNYTVEKLSTDSLIISNATRPCETKIFLKLK